MRVLQGLAILTLLLATATAAPLPAIIVEKDGTVSLVTCVEQSEIVFADGAFAPRCALVHSGELVTWALDTGALPGSQMDAILPAIQCLDAARHAQSADRLVAKFLLDAPELRVTTDFASARACAHDVAQGGIAHATLPVEDARTGARMLVVVREP